MNRHDFQERVGVGAFDTGRSVGSRSLVHGFVDQGLSSLSNVAILLAVARVVDVGTFGTVALLMLVVVTGLALIRGGIGTPLMLMGNRPEAEFQREARVGLLVATVVGIVLLVVILAMGVGFGVVALAWPIAVAAPVVLQQDVHRYVSMTRDFGRSAVVFDGLWAVASLAAFTATLFVEVGPVALLWVWVMGGLASCFGLGISSHCWPSTVGVRAWCSRARTDRVRFACEGCLGNVTSLAVLAILTGLVGTTAVAALRGAGTLLGPISVMFSAVPLAIIPRAVRSQQAPQVTWKVLRRLALAMAALALGVATGMHLLPASVGSMLLGDTWGAASVLLPLTGVEFAALAWLNCAWALFKAQGRSGLLLLTRCAHLCTAAVLAIIAAAHWGTAFAAAAGLAAGAAIVAAVVVGISARLVRSPRRHRKE